MLRRPLQCVPFQYHVCDSTYVAMVLANAACLTYVERAAMCESESPRGHLVRLTLGRGARMTWTRCWRTSSCQTSVRRRCRCWARHRRRPRACLPPGRPCPLRCSLFPYNMACMGSSRAQYYLLLWRSAEGLRYSAVWRRCGPAPAAVVSCAPSLGIKCIEFTGCAAEFYDGKADKMRCYNDLFIYDLSPKKDRWTQVVSPGGCACTLGQALKAAMP